MHCLPHLCYMNDICDLTNEIDILASHVGLAHESVDSDIFKSDLKRVVSILSSAMGSLRREVALEASTSEDLASINRRYQDLLRDKKHDVFQPYTGSEAVARLHTCRSMSKKISRMYLKIYYSKLNTDENIKSVLGSLSNTFYYMTILYNTIQEGA